VTEPLTDQQIAEIRAYHERTTHPDWMPATHVGQLLAEVTRLRADLASYQAESAQYDRDHERLSAELKQARVTINRLAHAAENGKHSLAAFAADTTDPGSAALGALYLLRNALAGQPDIEPAYLEITPERLRAAHFREAARLLEAADHDDDAVNLLDNVAHSIEQYNPNPVCTCAAEPVHQAGCDAN
jgi:hypothetical protein